MKDKKIEAAIKQLYKLVHPYMRDNRKCSIVFSPNGDIEMGWLRSVQVKMEKPKVSVIHATEEQIATLMGFMRNPKLGQHLVDEYTVLIQRGKIPKKAASNLIQKCIDNLKEKNLKRHPNLKPLV